MDLLRKVINEWLKGLDRAGVSEAEQKARLSAIPDRLDEQLRTLPEQVLAAIRDESHDVLEDRRIAHEKFVERNTLRWQKGFENLDLLIGLSTESGASFNREFRPQAIDKNDVVFDVLIRLHAKGCLISREIVTLLKNGFADGAIARWRALHEVSVTAMFIEKHGAKAATSYTDFECIERNKVAVDVNRYKSRINAMCFTEEEIRELELRRQSAISKHGKLLNDQYGWAREFLPDKRATFAAIEMNVRLDHWRPYYKLASQNTHANITSTRNPLGLSEAKDNFLLVGPSNSGMTLPAHSTAISLAQLTCLMLSISPNIERVIVAHILLRLSEDVGTSFLESDMSKVVE